MKSSAAGPPTPPPVTQVAACPKCRKAIDAAQTEAWCLECGTPLGEEIAGLLPKLVELRSAAARELEQPHPTRPISRGERVLRGMLGMGTAFGLVAAAIMAMFWIDLLINPRPVDRDEISFMMVASVGWSGIAFALGVLYGGLLAILARGRSFRELSIARVAVAGAAIGLVPVMIALRGGADDTLNALSLFPPLGAAIATATLLIARRARSDTTVEPPDEAV